MNKPATVKKFETHSFGQSFYSAVVPHMKLEKEGEYYFPMPPYDKWNLYDKDIADYLHSIDAEPECTSDVYVLEGHYFPLGTEIIHDAIVKE